MGFIGFDCFGDCLASNTLPARQAFSKIDVIGEGVIDELHIHNTEISDATILATNTVESFGVDTLALGHFENGLNMGNYTGLDTPIYKYSIWKRKKGDSQYSFVKEVTQESGVTQVIDYTSANFREYEYIILPVNIDEIMGTSSIASVTPNFYGYFLTNKDNTICFKFYLNIESSAVVSNIDTHTYENNSRFPVVNQGLRNYKSGSVKVIPCSLTSDGLFYEMNVDTLYAIEDFLNNKEYKILRNPSGEIMKVMITNVEHQYMDRLSSGTNSGEVYTLSFSYTQIGLVE